MVTRVLKWGNSLGIRIPKTVAERIQLFKGERIQMNVKDEKIIIEPLEEDVNLYALLATVTPEKINRSFWPDEIRGKEQL